MLHVPIIKSSSAMKTLLLDIIFNLFCFLLFYFNFTSFDILDGLEPLVCGLRVLPYHQLGLIVEDCRRQAKC